MTVTGSSQLVREAYASGTHKVSATQHAVYVMLNERTQARVGAVFRELKGYEDAPNVGARSGLLQTEVLATSTPPNVVAYCSNIYVEIMIPAQPRITYPQYPAPPNSPIFPAPPTTAGAGTSVPNNSPGEVARTVDDMGREVPDWAPQLMGITYTVFKRPVKNTGSFKALSGREVRVDYYQATIWEWDMTYSYLPGAVGPRHPSTTENDVATLMAFFLETRGGQMPFTFYDPDDHYVEKSKIGVTDGVKQFWTITRQYGLFWKDEEPIGYMITPPPDIPPPVVSPFGGYIAPLDYTPRLYLDDVLQDPTTYDLILTELGKQIVRFHVPPASGQTISMSFYFLFFTRFADLFYDFEQYLHQIWSAQKITLQSMRSYK
jgi:hypothetical protein